MEAQGGLFGNKKVYIPKKAYQEELAGVLKEAMQRDEIKAKLKEMKKNPKNRQLSDMVNYANDVTTVIMACVTTSLN